VRKGLFAVALSLAAIALFAVFARPSFDAPWSPAQMVVSDPHAWESAAQLRVEGAGVVAHGADAGGATMLLQAVEAFDAARFRYLAYDLGLARTDKAYFLWRSGGQLRNVFLPGAIGGDGVFDLQGVPGWEGEIDAIGVAATATDILHPAAGAEREFALRSLRLESPSWRGALAALRDHWTAYRPWTGRSNNTGGFEFSPQAGASWTLFAALLALVALGLACAWFGAATARRWSVPVIGIAALLLAAIQFEQLVVRGAVARAAALQARPGQPLSAQPQLAAAALELSAQLRGEGRTRVFVGGENQFLGEYATWLLREHNAAVLPTPEALPATLDAPALLVLVGKGPWQFDAAAQQLAVGGRRWHARSVYEVGMLRAYRIESGEVAP
jgi:hypothetical protein